MRIEGHADLGASSCPTRNNTIVPTFPNMAEIRLFVLPGSESVSCAEY